MNMNQLIAFTTVYETGSFSEAAQKLKLTQSAITQLIHGLEKDMETLLLVRSKRPISPTENGTIYYGYAKKIIQLQEDAKNHIKKENNHFTLAYRFTPNGILSQFLLANPSERPQEIIPLSIDDFNSASKWKENHLYFVRKDIIKSKNIHYTSTHTSKVYAVVSEESPLAKKETLTVEDLENANVILPKTSSRTIVTKKISSLLKDNPKIHVTEKDHSFDQALYLVSLYQAVVFCTEEFIRDFEKVRFIEFKSVSPFENGFACIGSPSPDMKAFIKSFTHWLHHSFPNQKS